MHRMAQGTDEDQARWAAAEAACEAAISQLPSGARPDQGYTDCRAENDWGMAIFCLEALGKEVDAPEGFWRHLLAAAEAVGAEDLTSSIRARLPKPE